MAVILVVKLSDAAIYDARKNSLDGSNSSNERSIDSSTTSVENMASSAAVKLWRHSNK